MKCIQRLGTRWEHVGFLAKVASSEKVLGKTSTWYNTRWYPHHYKGRGFYPDSVCHNQNQNQWHFLSFDVSYLNRFD